MQTILRIVEKPTEKPMETASRNSTRIDYWLLFSVIPVVYYVWPTISAGKVAVNIIRPFDFGPLGCCTLQSKALCGPLWSSGQDVWFSHLTSSGLLEQHWECQRWTCHLFWFPKADQKYLLAKHDHLWHQLHAELWRPWLNVLWRQLARQARDAKLPIPCSNLKLIVHQPPSFFDLFGSTYPSIHLSTVSTVSYLLAKLSLTHATITSLTHAYVTYTCKRFCYVTCTCALFSFTICTC